ncbi:DUF4405 domain-containing protein [Xylophilus sp. GW821-FHT01B05]
MLLDGIAAALLLVALAYYWLDNAAHEWIGTGIFLLVGVHNVFNRRWYGAIAKARREARGLIDVVLTLCLLVTMLALLLSSLMISRTVFSFLRLDGGFTVRQIHGLVAYWSLILVAIHLGLRWQRVMQAMRSAFHITGESAARSTVLRLLAAGIAGHGVWSSCVMGVGAKLSFQMSLDGWDFDASAPGFFLHWASIAGLYVCLAHYGMGALRSMKRKAALDA